MHTEEGFMSISRFIAIPLLAAVCALPAIAQTSSASGSTTLPPQIDWPSDSSDRILVEQFRLPAKPLLDSHDGTLAGLSPNELQPSQGFPLRRFLKPDTAQEDSASTCYS